jgi:hypothetical protein
LGVDRIVLLREKLPYNKRRAARCIIVMQKPLPLLLVMSLPPSNTAKPLQNFFLPAPRWSFFNQIKSVSTLFQ